jgi:hypothetical protein
VHAALGKFVGVEKDLWQRDSVSKVFGDACNGIGCAVSAYLISYPRDTSDDCE